MSKSARKLRMQGLEQRDLMAGDVAVAMDGFTLEIEETAGTRGEDQSIEIRQLEDGRIRVEGIGETLVNGSRFEDFSGVGALEVDLGSGDDRLDLIGNNKNSSGIALAELKLGSSSSPSDNDSDQLNVENFRSSEIRVELGADADKVSFEDVNWTGLSMDIGDGNDTVTILDASGGLTNIEGDVGHQNLTFKGGFYTTLDVSTGSGNDDVWVEDLFASQLALRTGSGLDDVDVRLVDAHWYAYIDTGSNNFRDTVDVRGLTLTFGDLTINTGDGNDYVNVQNSTLADDIWLNTGSGDDYARIEHVTARDNLFARLGSGDDRLLIDDSSFDWVIANGESGADDRLYLRGRNRFRAFAPSNFERIS